jgi:hypothetical protein
MINFNNNNNLKSNLLYKSNNFNKNVRLTDYVQNKNDKYNNETIINTYNKMKKVRLSWVCSHKDKVHYAKGKCKNCYNLVKINFNIFL